MFFFLLHCEVLKTFCCGYMICVCVCARVQACVGHGMGWRPEDNLEFGSLSSILVETGSLCLLARIFRGSPVSTFHLPLGMLGLQMGAEVLNSFHVFWGLRPVASRFYSKHFTHGVLSLELTFYELSPPTNIRVPFKLWYFKNFKVSPYELFHLWLCN